MSRFASQVGAALLTLALLPSCSNGQRASLEAATGAFATWRAPDCVCIFNRKGFLGVTADHVVIECTGYRAPEISAFFVEVNVNTSGERLYTQTIATGSMPGSGNPISVGGVSDSVIGRFEQVGDNRLIPVKVFKVELPPQRQCDPLMRNDCLDFPGASLTNLVTYCSDLGDNTK